MTLSSQRTERTAERQLCRWGGAAALAGIAMLLGSVVVVVSLGLPDASDPETLTDFADIEGGRVAEHFLYLGALILFALHVLVLQRLLTPAHPPAALFGTAVAEIGYVILAASSLLHVSTSPMSDLYRDPDASPDDLGSIEHAWHAAQSVFDTMLTTGVLLVPIGIVLLGIAMRASAGFGQGLTMATIGLGILGIVGAVIAVIEPGSAAAALSVLSIAVFHLAVGWHTWKLGSLPESSLTGERSQVNA